MGPVNEDADVLQENDKRRLQAALTFTRVAIQRHKVDPETDRNQTLYGCLPEKGAKMPDGLIETNASASHCRMQIIRIRKAIRRHMIDKNDTCLYRVLDEGSSYQIRFPQTLT